MRVLRAVLLLASVLGCAALLVTVVGPPLRGGWAVLTEPEPDAHSPAADLASLLLGGCALLLAVASAWILVAVAACTCDALLVRDPESDIESGSGSLLRPRVVRAVVVAFVGASAVGQAAHARPAAPVGEAPPAGVTAPSTPDAFPGPQLLVGLPAPDRVPGRMAVPAERVHGPVADGSRHRPGTVVGLPVPRSVEVRPGDSLWSLTARLLPPAAPLGAVATGWRLLYDANRAVVGDDPDLVLPGQVLRVSPALTSAVEAAGTSRPRTPRDAGGPR